MLEDILTDLASLGYVVSNTFQLGAGPPHRSPFGSPGWQVYLRNERNTRAGQGQGTTLGEALAAALAACEAQPVAAQRRIERLHAILDMARDGVEQCGFTGACAAGNDDVHAAMPGDFQEFA